MWPFSISRLMLLQIAGCVMELINATKMVAGYTMSIDSDAREHLVVVVKGTFDIPGYGGEPTLSEEQQPLVEADTFTGDPGFSAPVYESDYCLIKPRCDVLVNGHCYAPGGKPAIQVNCGFKVGALTKVIEVMGDRTWSGAGNTPGYPEPFLKMPITYDRAFGGCDDSNPDKARAFMENPVGMGFWPKLSGGELDKKPVPNLQVPGKKYVSPKSRYEAVSLGPVGRGWTPRLQHAGTYDDQWLEEIFPFLPKDFDARYFQAAPTDQQMDFPTGGEPVVLFNLTPAGRNDFQLPTVDLPLVFFLKNGDSVSVAPNLDTIVFDTDEGRFSCTWRSSLALKRNLFEVTKVLVGNPTKAWWRAQVVNKRHFNNLDEVVQARSNAELEAGPR